MSATTGNMNANKGNIKAAGQAGLSYNVEKSLAAKTGGSTKESHVVAPLDEVLALKALLEMSEPRDKKVWQDMINDATRMLRISAGAIQENPIIKERLGVSGLEGVMALSKLLKQRHADSVFNLALDDAIGEGNAASRKRASDAGLESVTERFDRFNIGGEPFIRYRGYEGLENRAA
jgi:hypothetical protein